MALWDPSSEKRLVFAVLVLVLTPQFELFTDV
jgi:hypothetical protein